ncbi:MAG: DUF6040 family protein [Firmicutes bacterium]|nr:DUF6040 family protein [Bacillota bacterium]MCL1953975.1 DUF6040 family protein [Bacillota bacterium]
MENSFLLVSKSDVSWFLSFVCVVLLMVLFVLIGAGIAYRVGNMRHKQENKRIAIFLIALALSLIAVELLNMLLPRVARVNLYIIFYILYIIFLVVRFCIRRKNKYKKSNMNDGI